jgi:hypothetical protein
MGYFPRQKHDQALVLCVNIQKQSRLVHCDIFLETEARPRQLLLAAPFAYYAASPDNTARCSVKQHYCVHAKSLSTVKMTFPDTKFQPSSELSHLR